MITPSNIVLILAATATALMTGLFYAWSCSVTIGIARLPDPEYMAAMQAMNDAILNPVFFAGFLGAAILLPVSTFMHYTQPASARFWLLLGATAVYLVGVFGVTFFGNVPLNDALKNFNLHTASLQEITAQRVKFEAPWNKLNTVRTVAATLAIVLVIIACLQPKEQ